MNSALKNDLMYKQPKDWIQSVLLRFDKLLESSVTRNDIIPSQLEEHKACLINSSQSKCSTVISGLTSSLRKLFNIRIYGERQELSLYNAQIIVLDVLEKCITSKDTLSEDFTLMRKLLPEICQLLYQPCNDKPVLAQLQASASRVLYCISQHNFDVVFNKISAKLQDLTQLAEEVPDLSDLELIHHIYIDLPRITQLLEEIGLKFRGLRKPAQMALASSLEKALWKWLCSYPTELNLLYQIDSTSTIYRSSPSGNIASTSLINTRPKITEEQQAKITQLSLAAEKLFDLLDVVTEGSKKKTVLCWPLQTMLLILCPELLRQVVYRQEGRSEKLGKHEHLNQLYKVVTGRHISESCADSYIRLLKAATCIKDQCYKGSAFEKLVNGFVFDLQVYLFQNNSKYFVKTLNQEALVECFISSFRLNPKKDNLIKLCASPNASVHLKMTLVQAFHCISTEPYLDWWPRIEQLYCYSSNIRRILHECVDKLQAQIHTSPRSSQSLREKMERMNVGLKRSQDELPTYKDLLLVVLQLIQGNPLIVLKDMGSCSQEVHNTAMKLFDALSSLFTVQNDANFPLSFESLGALLRLHDPQIIPMWNPESPISTLWDVSSTVLNTVCDTLLRYQLAATPEKASHTVKWIHEILTCRTAFFLGTQEKNLFSFKSDIVKKSQLKLEVTLLAHLWHSSSEVVMLSLSCFQCLHEELEISLTAGRSYPEHCTLYHQLASIPFINDGESIQERIATVFRRVRKFPPAALQAWQNLKEKWGMQVLSGSKQGKEESYTPIVAAGDSPVATKSIMRKGLLNQEEIDDWVSMTRFLCALGGVCVKIDDQLNSARHGEHQFSFSSRVTGIAMHARPDSPTHHGRSLLNKPPPAASQIDKFLALLLNIMAKNQYGTTRDAVNNSVRDLLGTCLHPALYPSLFHQIKVYLKDNLLDTSNHMLMNPNNHKFIELLVVMLRKIFEHCSDQDAEYLSEESMECMILHIVRYVRHTRMTSFSFQLRIKFCNMIAEMMKRKNDLFFLSEIQFRNKLVEHITDWIMSSTNQQIASDKSIARDLDESAIVALGILLKDLPLHPDEGDGGDVPQAKSQLFLKYFTLFMKLLSECAEELRSSERLNENVVTTKQAASLRKALIVAMSNLLSANIEYGLVHAMGLAYHYDVKTRAAFLEVLIKILQQGMAGFKSLSDSVLAERFERLVELVTMMGDNGELPIANALANVVHTTYMDELARVFVTLFDAKHLLYQLLWNMFSKEVEESDTVQTLFRGNSLASKIMTFCFKVYGASYLHNLVEPQVAWSMSPEISSLQFDIDQKRIPKGVDIHQCRKNLQRVTERFFTRIMTSTDKFPPQLKSVCHCLYQVVSQRFHESGTGAVASAIFLRFLNPAIATPYECGLCDKPPPANLARAFKYMCKIMQNIANHVVFTKEEHMKPFNDFVKARFDVCQQFFMQISTPECSSIETVVHSTSYVNDTNVAALHRLLWNDQEKIGMFLAKSRTAKAVGRRPFDKMVTLLAYLGPPEYTRPVLETRAAGQNINPSEFEELMIRRKVADSKEFKMAKSLNIFYQFGRSKMGYPVFYYIARRYIQADIREDILKFYILQALKPYSTRKFDIVFDLTQVGSKNSLRHLCTWLVAFPYSIYKNLDTVYIYNPNTWFTEYVDYNEETFNQLKKHQKFQFIEVLSDLKSFIELDHQKIPAATRSLDEDLTCYFHAYKSGSTKVDIKVGTKAVQITSVEKVKLFGHDVTLNDIYYSHEIESIQPHDSINGFTMAANNSLLLFSHPDASKIIESIRHIRLRWELTQPVEDISRHHTISAKDVPGTLLNMALLNLGCSHPLVRSSAYNLLCCLTHSFNLQLEGRLYQSEGLCIPANNTLFIVSISSTLARNESHLTLEFLKECITGFCRSSDKLKNLCLEYMEPWLFNLPAFMKSTEANLNMVKAIISQLIDLTIAEKNFYPSVQTKIWGKIGRMPDITDQALECFFEASLQAGLGSVKAEMMADTSVALAAHNMDLVSSKIIFRLCNIVDKTSLRPTPTLEKHKHWDEIAILARYLLMLSFNNNLDVVSHLPNLFHLVSLLLSTGPLSLRASIHGLVVNIIHSLLTCRQLECKDETQQTLRLSLTEFCLPKFYLFFGISNVTSAADTAFKSESFVHGQSIVGQNSHQLFNSTEADEDTVNLCFLDIVVDALLEILEACIRDMPTLKWLSNWQELSEKFAFQYNPSLQPRALVVFGCISKKVCLSQIKQILGILSRSLESQADPILFEACILCLTRLQLLLKGPHDLHCVFFWIGICVMQLNEKSLYAAGLSLIEQNLHHLDDIGAFTFQSFSSVLMKIRAKVERFFSPLESAINLSFQHKFHYTFVTHLMKGLRHPDSLVVTRVVRVLDFSLELVSRFRNSHKYEVNSDSSPYLAALLPLSAEVRRHCLPRQSSTTESNKSSLSKMSNGLHGHAPPHSHISSVNGHSSSAFLPDANLDSDTPSNGSQSSRNLHAPIPEDEVVSTSNLLSSVTSTEAKPTHDGKKIRKLAKRSDNYECGTTPPKLRKVVDGAHDSDSSTSSGSHLTSSSLGSNRKHSSDPSNNVLLDNEILDTTSLALILTLLAAHINHSPSNGDVEVVYEYLAQASICFPNIFPIVYSLLDQKISSVLEQCDDANILSHVQVVVHNALLSPDRDQTHRQLSMLEASGFGGIKKFTRPFGKAPVLDHASSFVKLLDQLIGHYLSDVSDLSSATSRHSLNSDLSATSADDVQDTDSESDCEMDHTTTNDDLPRSSSHTDTTRPLNSSSSKTGSFRNKNPNLTIVVPM